MIDLSRLIGNYDSSIDINELITFDNSYLDTTDIRSITPVKVTGSITKNDGEYYSISININGIMILPCSITLDDVSFPFDINYENDITDDEENLKITGNYLDIIPIVWENIVTEIPLRIVSPTAKLDNLKGDGWEVITEDHKKENEFAVLKDLLKEKEDE